VRAIRIPGPFVSLRSNDMPQRSWKAPMPSSTLLAARVRALAMVLAMALVAAPSHAGDDIRAGPTRTAKQRLGGAAAAWPLAAGAQQAGKVYRIGFFSAGEPLQSKNRLIVVNGLRGRAGDGAADAGCEG
jgi:hypothetical protein